MPILWLNTKKTFTSLDIDAATKLYNYKHPPLYMYPLPEKIQNKKP